MKEKLTLNNGQLLEDTLKAVISLCATDRSGQLSDNLAAEDEEDISSGDIKELLGYLGKVKNVWGQISADISENNNPFYLSDISNSKRKELQEKVNKLITSWEEKLKTAQQNQVAQIQVNPYGGDKK